MRKASRTSKVVLAFCRRASVTLFVAVTTIGMGGAISSPVRTSCDACFLSAGGGYFCGDRTRSGVFGKADRRSFYPCRGSCLCGIRLFLRDRAGLWVHGRICDTVFRLSGMGQATAPLLVSLLRVAIVLAGGWMLLQQQGPRLDWLYYLVTGSTVIGVLTLGIVFAFRPPNRRVLMLSG
jgi:hypothetical protein